MSPADADAPTISLRDVVRRFDVEGAPVLDRIDLEIAAGSLVALVGPSCSGKTTLLNLVAGLDRPDAGTVRVGDADVSTLDDADAARWRRSTVSSIFQAKGLVPHLTARENVDLALRLAGDTRGDGGADPVGEILTAVGLDEVVGHRPGQLSGGQQQRVAIARGLVVAPVSSSPTSRRPSSTPTRASA